MPSLSKVGSEMLDGALPALDASSLTSIPAANITGTLPAISGASLTNLDARDLENALPAISAASLTNLPASSLAPFFYSTISGQDVWPDAVTTKLVMDSEILDSDNCYDPSTNYRFTPTTAGKYFVGMCMYMRPYGNNDFHNGQIFIYKNGGAYRETSTDDYPEYKRLSVSLALFALVDMNGSSDYLEAYINLNTIKNVSPSNDGYGYGNFMSFRLGA